MRGSAVGLLCRSFRKRDATLYVLAYESFPSQQMVRSPAASLLIWDIVQHHEGLRPNQFAGLICLTHVAILGPKGAASRAAS